jgi:hypothetical protein
MRGLSLILPYCVLLLGISAPASGEDNPIYVENGQSIQSAIDSAAAGSQIIVAAGTYAEQLTITTDGITLVGQGAILTPPASRVQNDCTDIAGPETDAGICIVGSQVVLEDFVVEHRKVTSVGTRVKNVEVTGFEVNGFSGPNIVVVGGDGVSITGNHLLDGATYGVLSVGSLGSTIEGNAIDITGDLLFIALCMDDNLGGGVTAQKNTIAGYYVGICIQTDHAQVKENSILGCCTGAFVDPSIDGAQVTDNHIGPADPRCLEGDEPQGAFGIIIGGAVNTLVEANVIEGQTAGGVSRAPKVDSAGIAILDDVFTNTGALATDNLVTGNVLTDNDLDLLIKTNGTGNVVEGNVCSTPAELCG